jgi:hypothetical protein
LFSICLLPLDSVRTSNSLSREERRCLSFSCLFSACRRDQVAWLMDRKTVTTSCVEPLWRKRSQSRIRMRTRRIQIRPTSRSRRPTLQSHRTTATCSRPILLTAPAAAWSPETSLPARIVITPCGVTRAAVPIPALGTLKVADARQMDMVINI